MLFPRTEWNGDVKPLDKRTADKTLQELWQKVMREFQGLRVMECA